MISVSTCASVAISSSSRRYGDDRERRQQLHRTKQPTSTRPKWSILTRRARLGAVTAAREADAFRDVRGRKAAIAAFCPPPGNQTSSCSNANDAAAVRDETS